MRQVVLDTETTGIDPQQGHRIIEIGCVEMVDRALTGRHFHVYINPEREVEDSAIEVHGITNEFLADKPLFREVAEDFVAFVRGAELIIHNAPFDLGFLNHELRLMDPEAEPVESYCGVIDTLQLARKKHPGQKNNLDVLCRRYGIDNSHRDLHGALLDAEILADVYLLMSGGQTALSLETGEAGATEASPIRRLAPDRPRLPVVEASADEVAAHERFLEWMREKGGEPIWPSSGPV